MLLALAVAGGLMDWVMGIALGRARWRSSPSLHAPHARLFRFLRSLGVLASFSFADALASCDPRHAFLPSEADPSEKT